MYLYMGVWVLAEEGDSYKHRLIHFIISVTIIIIILSGNETK